MMGRIRYLPDLAVLASLALVPLLAGWAFSNPTVSGKSSVLYGLSVVVALLFATRPVRQVLTSIWALIILAIGLYWIGVNIAVLQSSGVEMLLLVCLGLAVGWIWGRWSKRPS